MKGCSVSANSLIKVYPTAESKIGKESKIKDFFHAFDSHEQYFIDSFTPRVLEIDRKKIVNVTTNIYSGSMIRLIMDFEEEISFLCTEEHKLPLENDEGYYVGKANSMSIWSLCYFYEKGKVVKHRVKAIADFEVKDLEVFNLVLETESRYSDGFFIDQSTNLIHHV